MPAETRADIAAIRAFGAANSVHADDLAAIGAALSAAPLAADALGAVGTGFLTALAEAITQQSGAVTALGERMSASRSAAYAAASAYDAADGHSGARIAGV